MISDKPIDSKIAQPRRAFVRPELRPLPKHIMDRLTPGFHFYSLATPVEDLRARLEAAPKLLKIGAALLNDGDE